MPRRDDRISLRQRRLADEIGDLLYLFHLEPEDLLTTRRSTLRTIRLTGAKEQLIRSEVMNRYTVLDEYLNTAITSYFFKTKRPYPKLWRRKRSRLFSHHVLEGMSVLKKLQLLRAIREVPKSIREDVERLNALRNGLAHSYFPHRQRSTRPVWKGTKIFTLRGIRRFLDDFRKIDDYFAPGTYHLIAVSGEGEQLVAQQGVPADVPAAALRRQGRG